MSTFIMSGAQFTSFINGISASKKKETMFYALGMAAAYQARWFGNFDAPSRAHAVIPSYAKEWFNALEGACREAHENSGVLKDAGWDADKIQEHLDEMVQRTIMIPYADRAALKTAEKEEKEAAKEAKKEAEKDKVYIKQGGNQMELSPEEAAKVMDLIRSMRSGIVGAEGADIQHNALKVVNA